MYNENILDTMKKIPLLKNFKEKDLRKVLEFSKIKQFKPGEIIVEEGKYESLIYYLIKGKIKIEKKGEEVYVTNRTGDIFGEMSAIDGSARSASVIALEDTMCLVLDFSFELFPAVDRTKFKMIIYKEFSEVLATRLRVTTEELIETREKLIKLKNIEKNNE